MSMFDLMAAFRSMWEQSTVGSRQSTGRVPRRISCGAFLVLAVAMASAPAFGAEWRDPFWPIGWEPPKPKVEAPVQPEVKQPEPQAEQKPAAPAPKPSDIAPLALWLEARKQVKISGQSRARGSDGVLRQVIYINGKGYSAGDSITLDYQDYRFTWRLREGNNQELLLKPLKSVRIAAADETTTPTN
ncbi:MAG: hypothetical protein ACI4RT_03835 [Candidatus Spyradenecus sp.]